MGQGDRDWQGAPQGLLHEAAEDGLVREIGLEGVLKMRGPRDFRASFLQKLSQTKVWVPQEQRAPSHQTVVIFDWDDTLLCTSFLNMQQGTVLPPATEKRLQEIGRAAVKLVELAINVGQTFIITNAMKGWVEYSCAKWVPELLPMLQKVRIISARTRYEADFPDEVAQWKIQAFLEVQRQLDNETIANLISVGDSNFEMDALHVMGREFSEAVVKTVKLRERPGPEELQKQLEVVCSKFDRIVTSARSLKIGLERRFAGAPPTR